MNRTYRVIFNHATGVWQCVSELARSKGKSKSVKALAVAVGLLMSEASFGADIEYRDGQTHAFTGNTGIDGSVLIINPNTKLTTTGQLVFGNSADTTAEISNQAAVVSDKDIAISAGKNASVTVDNASLENKSGVIALGLTPPSTAKLIGKNGAKITSASIISIANVENSTASIELSDNNTTLKGTVINVGEQAGAKGTLTLSDEANVNAEQLLIGRGNGATGTLNIDNATIDAQSMIVGVYGKGVANLTDGRLNLSESYALADSAGSTAQVVSKNNTVDAKFSVIGTSSTANLNSDNDRYTIQNSIIFGQEAGSKATALFNNSQIHAKDINLGVLTGSQADVTLTGKNTHLDLSNALMVGNGGTGSLTLDKTSEYAVGKVRATQVYIGGSSEGGY